MKNKGFTLVELLAVIVILAIILAIAIPSISSLIDNSRASAYESNERMLAKAARLYVTTGTGVSLPTTIGGTTVVSLSTLQSSQLIGTIQDLKDKAVTCDGSVMIRKIDATTYDYEPYLKCGNNYSTDGLVAWYPMNGNANDASGNAYNGTATGVTWTQSGVHTVGSFSGTSDISVTNFYNSASPNPVFLGTSPSTADNYNGNATYSAWIRATTLDTTARSIVCDSNFNEGKIDILSTGVTANWSGSFTYTATMQPNTWYFVTMTHERDSSNNLYRIKLYLNGALVANTTTSISGSASTYGPDSKLVIGYQWIGLIDDIRIYNKTFTANEILKAYNDSNYGR